MKKFSWSLQKLLDVTSLREQSAKIELSMLTAEIIRIKAEIKNCKNQLIETLKDISKQPIQQRITSQICMGEYEKIIEKKISEMNGNVSDLSRQRNEKIEQMMQIRSYMQMLEKMRDDAKQKYMREYSNYEQKLLDETACMNFNRLKMTN